MIARHDCARSLLWETVVDADGIRVPFVKTPGSGTWLVSTYALASAIVAIGVFLITLSIDPYDIGVDQDLYIKAYEGISDLGLMDGFAYYVNTVGSGEIVHFLLSWVASGRGMEKRLFMAIPNALLAYFAMRLFEKWKADVFVSAAIVLTNLYFLLMYFVTERLKLGFLALAISILYLGQRRRFVGFALLAVLSHVQVVLFYAGMFLARLADEASEGFPVLRNPGRRSVLALATAALTLAPLVLVAEHVYSKFLFYSESAADRGVADSLRIVLLLIMSLWYSKNARETVALFIPAVLAVAVIGSDRANLVGYFIFLFYGLQCNGGWNVGVLVTTVYFAFKSFNAFLYLTGHGSGVLEL
jgi:hypothetical protein